MRGALGAFLALPLALPLAMPAAAGSPAELAADPSQDRVIAVGDIHGSIKGLTAILRASDLIDESGKWSGGKATFVQTGDFTDRGTGVREVMDLLMDLQGQARAAGGQVVVLLGNHEMLNLMHHDLDVMINPSIYTSFAGDKAAELQHEAFDAWKAWKQSRLEDAGNARLARRGVPIREEREWLARHPLGFVEYHRSMSPEGTYGRWLRSLPAIHQIGRTVFLHGGISAGYADLGIDEINKVYEREIGVLDETRRKLEKSGVVLPFFTWAELQDALLGQLEMPSSERLYFLSRKSARLLDRFVDATGSSESPLWYRGFARPPRGLSDAALANLWKRLNGELEALHFVTAHSPFNGGDIAMRLDGSFFLIDTGMLEGVYDGRASALEIRGSRFNAIYPEERTLLYPPEEADEEAADTARPPAAETPGGAPARRQPLFALASLAAQETSDAEGDLERPSIEIPQRHWIGPDGAELPFADHEELEDFLLNANVVHREPVGEGKTGADRLTLERDGVRARAIFHTVDDHRHGSSQGPVRLSAGSTMLHFRDSYSGQAAAYRLSRLMGLDNVPATVVRKVNGAKGSVALWIENGTTLTAWREVHPRQPQGHYYMQQLFDMRVFDVLVNNKDRNTGNIFWTPDFNLWLIDHTRTFARDHRLFREHLIQRCSRSLLERIRALNEKEATRQLKRYLSVFEIKAIFKRRKQLLRYLDDRVEKLGEKAVFFEYGKSLGRVRVGLIPEAAS